MFTGIIQSLGHILEAHAAPARELRLCVESRFVDSRSGSRCDDVQLGESIAVNGVCLTATEFSREADGSRIFFHVSRETLDRSNLGILRAGSKVNLERALLATDRLSGHIVQGHVDGLARFVGAQPSGESHEVGFELPEELARYCIEKGSIALNGVSLTLNSVRGREIRIMLIPHTWQHTNLSSLEPGAEVNVEVDIFAKYAEKFSTRSEHA